MMRKITLALIVLALTMPALAVVDVNITPVLGELKAEISFTVSGEGELVRALALDITVDTGTIVDVNASHVGECNSTNQGYGIFMGTIQIDGNGDVTNDGTPVAPQSDLPGDTLGGIGTGGVTVELGSLYEDGNAPGTTDVIILTVTVSADCNMCVATNVGRAGVVLEDGKSSEDVSSPLVVTGPGIDAEPCTYISEGPPPNCWDPEECVGQSSGDANCDGNISGDDLKALKDAFGTNYWTFPHGTGIGEYNCCSDFDHTGASYGYISGDDLYALKGGFGSLGLTPSTGQTQASCPVLTAP